MPSKQVIDRVMQLIQKNADDRIQRAKERTEGWGTDVESERYLREVRFYQYGWDQVTPPEWRGTEAEVLKQMEIENNPESYKEYLALKKRFEGA